MNMFCIRTVLGRMVAGLLCGYVGSLVIGSGVGQAAVPLVQRAVDLVAVTDGPTYLGAVISPRNSSMVRMAVQRKWFEKSLPDEYRTFVKRETQQRMRESTELTKRIEAWIQSREGDEALTGFLQSELDRLRKQAAPAGGLKLSQFVIVDIDQAEVRRVYRQPMQRKQLALLAWRERVADVEELSIDDLRRKLTAREVTNVNNRVDLSDRLPPASQSSMEWAARVAVVEYQYRQSVDFQGMGSALLRTDGDAAPLDVKNLVQQLLPGQLDLEGLLNGIASGATKPRGGDGLQKAAKTTAELGCRGFRVTRIGQDVLGGRARVTGQFVAQMPDGKWRMIWTETATVTSNQVTAAQLDRVEQDPRVKQIFTVAKTLGLGGEQLQTALRFGAATMQAQQEIDGRFYEFRDRYISQLDK